MRKWAKLREHPSYDGESYAKKCHISADRGDDYAGNGYAGNEEDVNNEGRCWSVLDHHGGKGNTYLWW